MPPTTIAVSVGSGSFCSPAALALTSCAAAVLMCRSWRAWPTLAPFEASTRTGRSGPGSPGGDGREAQPAGPPLRSVVLDLEPAEPEAEARCAIEGLEESPFPVHHGWRAGA